MRYAIFSDIHSNLEALKSIITYLKKEKIEQYLCVGDIIGYGTDPQPCIELVQELKSQVVMGNHDYVVGNLAELNLLNDWAQKGILFSKEKLTKSSLLYLKNLPLILSNDTFTLVHSSLAFPDLWSYIMDSFDAKQSFDHQQTPLCFIGHSHKSGIFEKRGSNVSFKEKSCLKPEEGIQYIVNVGSVGQPRDRDPRSSFVIYDTEENYLEIKRVAYDIKSTQEKIIKSGLPKMLAARLSEGK